LSLDEQFGRQDRTQHGKREDVGERGSPVREQTGDATFLVSNRNDDANVPEAAPPTEHECGGERCALIVRADVDGRRLGLVPCGGQVVVRREGKIVFVRNWSSAGEHRIAVIVADLVPGARLVKAANKLAADVLGADPHDAGGRRVIFLSGDDAPAKAAVAELFDAAGFFPIDLGELVTGGRTQQLGGPLPSHNLVRLPAVR
jgi:hypothetical protein